MAMRGSLDLAIERTYGAATGETSWREALAAATRAFGAHGALLFTPELARESGGLSVSFDSSGTPGALHIVPQDAPRQPQSNRTYSTVLDEGDDEAAPRTLFVISRADTGPPFGDDDRRAIQLYCAHLARAVRFWYRERLSRHCAEALASRLHAAALITDSDARITWKNASADAWVREGRASVANGRMVALPGIDIELARVIRDVAERRAEPVLAASHDATVEIVAVALPGEDGAACTGSALLILRDRSGCRQAAAALAANFRLTATEVDLALALWKGLLVGEYASQRNVAMSTVRTQLKSLLAKTRTRRQSDVVATVARLLPLAGYVKDDSIYAGHDIRNRRHTSNG